MKYNIKKYDFCIKYRLKCTIEKKLIFEILHKSKIGKMIEKSYFKTHML